MENLTQRWIQSGPFFESQITFLNFQKRAGEAFPSPSCASVGVAEYS